MAAGVHPVRCLKPSSLLLVFALYLLPRVGVAQRQDGARAGARAAPAQEMAALSPPAARARTSARDSLRRPPISPRAAFLYSLAVPGLGQSKIDRGYAGGLFFTVEVVAIAMLRQAVVDLHYAQRHLNDSTLVVLKYRTDSLGQPIDSAGKPIPLVFGYNRYDSARVRARKTHVEDWEAVLIFNHLLAGADAFVAAQLWDLPAHVRPTAHRAENGRLLVGAAVSW